MVKSGLGVGQILKSVTAQQAGSAWEILLDQLLVQTQSLENLSAAIARKERDAHLGHDLLEAFLHCFDEILMGCGGVQALHLSTAFLNHFGDRFQGQKRIDGVGSVAQEAGEVVDFSGLAAGHDETGLESTTFPSQVLVDGTDG